MTTAGKVVRDVKTWGGWAVLINDRFRCAFPSNEKDVAINEAERYGDDGKVVRVEVKIKKSKKAKRKS